MGWWGIGDEDDERAIGDGPVDRLEDALRALPSRPSVQALVDAATAALRRDADELVCDPAEAARGRVAARAEGGSPAVIGAPDDAAPELVDAMLNAFDDMGVDYLDSEMERRPYVSEVLETLTFVLRGRGAGEYLSDTGGIAADVLEFVLA